MRSREAPTRWSPAARRSRTTAASRSPAAVKEGLKCRFVIEERVAGSYRREAQRQPLPVPPARRRGDHGRAGRQPTWARRCSRWPTRSPPRAARPTSFPGGGSNALGGLGYVACAQELQQQCFELRPRLRPRRRRLGQLGHARRPASPASSATASATPIVGIGVSRDPADQEPLVHREAQAVLDLLGAATCTVPREAVRDDRRLLAAEVLGAERARWSRRCRCWRAPKALLLDPVYTGKAMAGLIGLARKGFFAPGEKRAVPAHRRAAVAVRLRRRGAGRQAGGLSGASPRVSRPAATQRSSNRARARSGRPFFSLPAIATAGRSASIRAKARRTSSGPTASIRAAISARGAHPAEGEDVEHRVLEPAGGALPVAQAPHRDQVLRPRQAGGVDLVGLLQQQALHLDHELLGVLRRGRGLDHELPGELGHVGRARHVIGEAAPLADLVEQRRAHAFAEQRRGDGVGVLRLVGRAPASAGRRRRASGPARRSPSSRCRRDGSAAPRGSACRRAGRRRSPRPRRRSRSGSIPPATPTTTLAPT